MRKLNAYFALPFLLLAAALSSQCQQPSSSTPDAFYTDYAEPPPITAFVPPQTTPANPPPVAPQPSPTATAPAPAASIPAPNPHENIRPALAELARAHDQKTQLAFYESLPWRKTPEPYHAFYTNMGEVQADLLKQVRAWASKNHVDLTYSFANDPDGRAEKILEARQEKLIRGDDRADFTRDSLMQMYDDYEWQISLIQALMPAVQDPELKTYLQNSLKIHEDGSAQLQSLLKRFK